MAYVGADFTPVLPDEDEVYAFDFINDLPTGDNIVSTFWTCSVAYGIDPDAASYAVGPPQFLGTVSAQRFTGFKPNVKYALEATVNTSMGNVISLFAHLLSQPVS